MGIFNVTITLSTDSGTVIDRGLGQSAGVQLISAFCGSHLVGIVPADVLVTTTLGHLQV